MADASKPLPLELLERGDPAFVDAIRQYDDADTLAAFAEIWFNDRRADSRRLLFEYLDRPLNAYRHEGLVKRLFKLAEAAGDDEVMARFLVLFDRSIRRVRKKRVPWSRVGNYATREEAEATASVWRSLGYHSVYVYEHQGQFSSVGCLPEEVIVHPRKTTMPRGRMVEVERGWPARKHLIPDWAIALKLDWEDQLNKAGLDELPQVRARLQKFRLFSVATRNYLRRRAWRYFRKLGKTQPERYVAAVSQALTLYRDEDVADGLKLIDNWGLVHILFHHSPVLEAKPSGWTTKHGRSLGELSPTPAFETLWNQSPAAVVGLLATARSATVRRWAIRRVEADLASHVSGLPLEGWLNLLSHEDPEIASLAARVVEGLEGLESVGVDRWLLLAETADPGALEVLCRLIDRHVKPHQVTLEQALKLARLRTLPVAKLGFSWLKTRTFEDSAAAKPLLSLIEAECNFLRPEILSWLHATLASSSTFEPAMILEFLDARQLDARTEGWNWFLSDPRSLEDVALWQKLLESPYDDVRLNLVAELESKAGQPFQPENLGPLWASVLLNIHRGSRAKPVVVRQLVERLRTRPAEAPALLPLLGVALRSVRGPERRAGLVAVVQLVEQRSEIEPLVRSTFPELQWVGDLNS